MFAIPKTQEALLSTKAHSLSNTIIIYNAALFSTQHSITYPIRVLRILHSVTERLEHIPEGSGPKEGDTMDRVATAHRTRTHIPIRTLQKVYECQ